MKWLVFLALVACTHKTPEKAPEASAPTESSAKPISPLTVEPCYCMKIFEPVCAGGQNYGNSCEAECHGHKTWTKGSCKDKPKK